MPQLVSALKPITCSADVTVCNPSSWSSSWLWQSWKQLWGGCCWSFIALQKYFSLDLNRFFSKQTVCISLKLSLRVLVSSVIVGGYFASFCEQQEFVPARCPPALEVWQLWVADMWRSRVQIWRGIRPVLSLTEFVYIAKTKHFIRYQFSFTGSYFIAVANVWNYMHLKYLLNTN